MRSRVVAQDVWPLTSVIGPLGELSGRVKGAIMTLAIG
jgi:hypothetical protein